MMHEAVRKVLSGTGEAHLRQESYIDVGVGGGDTLRSDFSNSVWAMQAAKNVTIYGLPTSPQLWGNPPINLTCSCLHLHWQTIHLWPLARTIIQHISLKITGFYAVNLDKLSRYFVLGSGSCNQT